MQPSRMVNESASRHAELMRGAAAMRLAKQASGKPERWARRFLSADTLSFRIGNRAA